MFREITQCEQTGAQLFFRDVQSLQRNVNPQAFQHHERPFMLIVLEQ